LRERRTEDAEENQEDGRRRQKHENGGETHRVAVVVPPRFPDKDRFTSSRPDFVLVLPSLQKHKNNKLM